MDKFKAQQVYWESIGAPAKMPAYNELTVPEEAPVRKVTYQLVTGALDGLLTASASIWDKSTSWSWILQYVAQIEKLIDRQIPVDGGYMKVRKPIVNFAQPMTEPTDDMIRRVVLTVEIEFLAG